MTSSAAKTELLLNDFAIRSFRDEGDADYISARLAFRTGLSTSLWASLQMVEKYLKCILLLNRIPGKHVKHDLRKGLDAINNSGIVSLDLSPKTQGFINYIGSYGQYRYLEVSRVVNTMDIVQLDRTAWELRRFCTLNLAPRQVKLINGVTIPKVELPGGYLESIINDKNNPARKALVWQNAFFGKRQRRFLRNMNGRIGATNAPLELHPEILDRVLDYVYLPKQLVKDYRSYALTK